MIKVLFFAGYKEELGMDQLEIESEHIETVQQLKEYIQNKYPISSLQQVLTAVNEEFVTNDDPIHSGDTVAFIPPVSGG